MTLHDADVLALRALYGGEGGAWGPLVVALTILGGGWSTAALVPLVWMRRTRAFAAALATAIAAQAIVVFLVKAIVGRVRPWIALGLPAPLGAPHDGSFPSGHAAGSFCVAAFLLVALPAVWPAPRARLAGACALVLAALVALSRVYVGAHFLSDVVAGAALGALAGALAGRLYALERARDPR